MVALLTEGVGRNRRQGQHRTCRPWSPSSRRAWVEMPVRKRAGCLPAVALLTEGVGRNSLTGVRWDESVRSPSSRRAWVEIATLQVARAPSWSPSSRRAWVEIAHSSSVGNLRSVALLTEGVGRNALSHHRPCAALHVALLTEGVGRNTNKITLSGDNVWSPSSRRAWVEIPHSPPGRPKRRCRPPHGGRG